MKTVVKTALEFVDMSFINIGETFYWQDEVWLKVDIPNSSQFAALQLNTGRVMMVNSSILTTKVIRLKGSWVEDGADAIDPEAFLAAVYRLLEDGAWGTIEPYWFNLGEDGKESHDLQAVIVKALKEVQQ